MLPAHFPTVFFLFFFLARPAQSYTTTQPLSFQNRRFFTLAEQYGIKAGGTVHLRLQNLRFWDADPNVGKAENQSTIGNPDVGKKSSEVSRDP